MCGRYTLSQEKEKIRSRFAHDSSFEFSPRYNVSPGQFMPVLAGNYPAGFSNFIWGLIPNYSPDAKSVQHYFNIKSEQLLTRSPFKHHLRSQRCLVPADGYFDWKKEGKQNIPYRFTLMDDGLFAMAGIWDSWENPKDGSSISSFSILTKPASGTCREISDRMPVILKREAEKSWMNLALHENDVFELISKDRNEEITYYKCHKIVNSADKDVPQCVEAAPRLYPGETYNLFDV